jgi:hypothetical protein
LTSPRAILLLVFGLAAPACRCGFDASALDDLACSTDSDCAPDQDCQSQYCTRRDCDDPADCGDDAQYLCESDLCWAEACGDGDPCTDGFECVAGHCRTASCDQDGDCDDELYCTGQERCEEGACVPGAPPACATLEDGPCDEARCDEALDLCRLGEHPCDDLLDCTTDACVDEACSHTVVDGFCSIGGACFETGAQNPANGCEECQSGSPGEWTVDDANECEDGEACTTADSCSGGRCAGTAYSCDDGLECTTDGCDGAGGCENAPVAGACAVGGACYAAGDPNPANVCEVCDPALDQTGFSPDPANDCDDADPCTRDEGCGTGRCTNTAYSCTDGLTCTTDVCDGAGGCSYPVALGACLIGGVCRVQGEANAQNVCEECDPAASTALWTVDAANAPSDGIDCTVDSCAGGSVTHVADDASCGGGNVCAVCAGGCVAIPTLTVDCPAGPNVTGAAATCTVRGAAAGQGACLSCSSLIGMTSLVRNTFEGCPSLGDLGWALTGQPPQCPADRELGPDPGAEEDQLEFREEDNPRFSRDVDTSDFDSVRLCFDYADYQMGGGDSLTVSIDTGAGWSPVWTDTGGPMVGVDRNWVTICLDLDAEDPLAADNPTLGIRFEQVVDNAELYLDNIMVDAWNAADLTHPGRVVDDDFGACDLGGWVASGDPVVCPLARGPEVGRDALEATNDTWTIDRTIDLSDRCEDVQVGFSPGSSGADSNDRARLTFDRGGGDVVAWASYHLSTSGGLLAPLVVNLSHLDPSVRFQAGLGVGFSQVAQGLGDSLFVDDVWVDGASCESGDDFYTLGAPADAGGGSYTIALSSPARSTGYLECSWDGRAGVAARDQIVFCAPVCTLGEEQTQACGECGTQTRTCLDPCTWGPWAACVDHPCTCTDEYGNPFACCC